MTVDTTSSVDHCGRCGKTCSSGIGCFAGACTSPGSLSLARAAHALVKGDDGKIYCLGGAYGVGNGQETASVEVYDPRTNHWRKLAPLGTARFGLGAAARTGQILAFGGSKAFNAGIDAEAFATTEIYDPVADVWHPGANLETGRADAAFATAPDGRVWLIGGWTFWPKPPASIVFAASDEIFEPSWQWSPSAAPPPPTPRWAARAVATADGRIWVVGGVAEGKATRAVDVLDPATMTWSKAEGGLKSGHRLGAAALGADGRIYVAGGYDDTEVTAMMEAYDPATETTSTKVAPLPVSLVDTAAVAADDGKIYVVGGAPAEGAPPLEAMFVYDPARDVWYQ